MCMYIRINTENIHIHIHNYIYIYIYMGCINDDICTQILSAVCNCGLYMYILPLCIPQEVLGSSPPTMEAVNGTVQRAKIGADWKRERERARARARESEREREREREREGWET